LAREYRRQRIVKAEVTAQDCSCYDRYDCDCESLGKCR
jgi:hypothetical protein